MTLTLQVPAELIDIIISSIDDKDSLKSCSLVARSWVPCSRLHLFRSVQLFGGTLPSFFELLYDQHSTIRCAVERIRLSGIIRKSREFGWSKWVCDGFAELAPLLPRLSRLELHNLLGFQQFTGPDILGLSFGMTPLARLDLYSVKFASFMQVSNLILAFPTLEDLSIMYVHWQESCSGCISVSSMRLQCLKLLCGERDVQVTNWLLSQDPIPLISYYSWGVHSYEGASAIGWYLRIVGSSLTNLVINFAYDGDTGT